MVFGCARLPQADHRFECPAQWQPRTARASASLAGVDIPVGARAALVWGSANRDEAVFRDSDTFDILREDVDQHVAFGFGTHFCLGAALARAEGRIAFERLLSRLNDLECQVPFEEVRYFAAPNTRTIESLLLRFHAA